MAIAHFKQSVSNKNNNYWSYKVFLAIGTRKWCRKDLGPVYNYIFWLILPQQLNGIRDNSCELVRQSSASVLRRIVMFRHPPASTLMSDFYLKTFVKNPNATKVPFEYFYSIYCTGLYYNVVNYLILAEFRITEKF